MRTLLLKTTLISLSIFGSWQAIEHFPIPSVSLPIIIEADAVFQKTMPTTSVILIEDDNTSERITNLREQLISNNNIIIDRKNEKTFLDELERQSQIPADINSVNPIGEILIPRYLLKEEILREGFFNIVSTITMSEIKSGRMLWQDSYHTNKMSNFLVTHSKRIFKFIYVTIVTILLSLITFKICSPLILWCKKHDQENLIKKDFKASMQFLKKGNIEEGTRLLVKCADSNTRSEEASVAIKILSELTIKNEKDHTENS